MIIRVVTVDAHDGAVAGRIGMTTQALKGIRS